MRFFLIKIIFVIFFLTHSLESEEISSHFHKLENKSQISNPFNNIDYIYLINLDYRPEKLKRCINQLEPYEILPYRFSAINGWQLSTKELENLGVPNKGNGKSKVTHTCFGKSCFSRFMSRGAIGCTLSHLSILQDAYTSQYKYIWILEDDIIVVKNPLLLDSYIEELNLLVGKENWDILYTDIIPNKKFFHNSKHMKRAFWRPDIKETYKHSYTQKKPINETFLKINSRLQTHSMVISKSGIEKILKFYKQNPIYIPYDLELGIIPDMNIYNLRFNIVTASHGVSDTSKKR